MHASSRKPATSPAPSRSRDAAPNPSTVSPSSGAQRSTATSITSKRSSGRRGRGSFFLPDNFATQSTLPMHTAIIMDGNGRWARARNLRREAGHRAGARAVDAVIRAAARHGVTTLTLYAFSSDNWFRPHAEVEALFGLLRRYLMTQTERCLAQSLRLNVIGRRDRLSAELRRQIEHSEALTADCTRMHVRIAVDYSA